MASVNFRKIDIDALDPENQVSAADFMPALRPVTMDEVVSKQQQVKQASSRGDHVGALSVALQDPPYGGDEQVKALHLKTVIELLTTIRASDIGRIVQQLSSQEQDVLVKYLYKGMGSPIGQSHGNGAVLLSWFEKTGEVAGQGPIIRYLSDKRLV